MAKKRLNLTERDKLILSFLNKGFIARSDQLNELFFETQMSYRRRLRQLTDAKLVKRYRIDGNHSYVYYTGKLSKEYKKQLFWTEFLIELNKYAFELDEELSQPHAYGILYYDNQQKIGFYNSDFNVVLKTPYGNILLFIKASLRGSYDGVDYRRTHENYPHMVQDYLKKITFQSSKDEIIPIPIHQMKLVVCSPHDLVAFQHLSLRPSKLKEDIPSVFQNIQKK